MFHRVVESLSTDELTCSLLSVEGRLYYIQELDDPGVGAHRGLIRRVAMRPSLRDEATYFRRYHHIDVVDSVGGAHVLRALMAYVEKAHPHFLEALGDPRSNLDAR